MDNGARSYRRYLDGDDSAFDDIMKEMFDNLIFFVNRYVNDPHTAEDIAIDAFADLVVHKTRYNFKVTLKTYLFMVARSRALNCLKRRKRRAEVCLSEDVRQETKTLEEMFLANEREKQLHAALQKLSEDMRAAIHLVYFEGLSYDETACVMKKNRKQIDNLLYRAKKELRAILGKEAEEYL